MADSIYICGVSAGQYSAPQKIVRRGKCILKFEGKVPKILSCESPTHCGKRRRFPIEEMYCQLWELDAKKVKQAVKNYDLLALEPLPPRILCKDCARKEIRNARNKAKGLL